MKRKWSVYRIIQNASANALGKAMTTAKKLIKTMLKVNMSVLASVQKSCHAILFTNSIESIVAVNAEKTNFSSLNKHVKLKVSIGMTTLADVRFQDYLCRKKKSKSLNKQLLN